eukprot:1480527-Pyramimonas_sp.AAC.1
MGARAARSKETPQTCERIQRVALLSHQRLGDRNAAINAPACEATGDDCDLDADARGECAEQCFAGATAEMALDEPQLRAMRSDELGAARVGVSAEIKLAVV